jgi:hypothetical protein
VYENRTLRQIFGAKRDEMKGSWKKKIQIKDLYNLCSSPYIIIMFKSKRKRWAGHVAYVR